MMSIFNQKIPSIYYSSDNTILETDIAQGMIFQGLQLVANGQGLLIRDPNMSNDSGVLSIRIWWRTKTFFQISISNSKMTTTKWCHLTDKILLNERILDLFKQLIKDEVFLTKIDWN